MSKISYVKIFKVGCFSVECDGVGEVVIYPNQETDTGEGRLCFSISIDELNDISDIASRHKIDWEDENEC